MAALINYVREEMDRQDINQVELARRAEVPVSTLNRHLNGEVDEWKPSMILSVAKGLNVDFWRLMVIAGYPVDRSGSPADRDRRRVELAQSFPWMDPLMNDIAALDPDDQASVQALVETLHRRRKTPRS